MIVLAIPIPIAVAIGTAIGYFMMDLNLVQVALSMYTGVEPFPLVTVPLFVFAGSLMEQGGMARRIVNMAQSMIGNYTGSLGLVAVLGCAFFAALSGSGPATTAAIGAVMIPSMIKQKWDPAMGGAIAAAGGALGSLIPPSNLMIIYGIVAEQSIPRLFLAGFIPGFVATALLMVTVYIIAKKRNYVGDGVEFSWSEVRRTLVDGKWAILAPFIILGGIYSGAFTPTEAASVAVFYALLIGGVAYKELTIKKIFACLKVTAMISGAVLIIVGPAKAFGELMSLLSVPDMIGDALSGVTESPFILLMIISVILIITGMFLESIAQIILLTPLLLPIVMALGIDPIVFGIIMVISCEVGFLTPPVGANLFVAARITNLGIDKISIAVLPFLLAYIGVLIFVSLFPDVVTWLPDLVYGNFG
ncbi:MAG: C4-dicarboxylate ABC transporter permease [SAR116 cluster bacterium]|nr:C4-dicarboxylate ABC transporter permease [SAR116 cluster bacterium]RPG92488.1 MAG: TRAP transporter large permease [Candidatus Puniceispirillum sp. TMED213]